MPPHQSTIDPLNELSSRLLHDLALLIAGHDPAFEYADPAVRERLRAEVEPVLARGDAVRPDFANAELNVLRAAGEIVGGSIAFDDRSTLEAHDGAPVGRHDRRVTVEFTTDPAFHTVRAVRITPGLMEAPAAASGASSSAARHRDDGRPVLFQIPDDWRRLPESGPGLFGRWMTPDDIRVSSVAAAPPNLNGSTLAEFRTLTAKTMESDERLIDCDVVLAAGRPVIRWVQARTVADQPGIAYIGWVWVPWKEATLAIQTVAWEKGTTGRREAAVVDTALARGEMPDLQPVHGPEGLQQTVADDPQHDAQFPEHPLTRTRALLNHIVETLTLPADAREWTIPDLDRLMVS